MPLSDVVFTNPNFMALLYQKEGLCNKLANLMPSAKTIAIQPYQLLIYKEGQQSRREHSSLP